MTKKDYIKIADVLLKVSTITPEEVTIKARIAGELAIMFKKDNPLFDPNTWFNYLNSHS